jgi:hypothetical protein
MTGGGGIADTLPVAEALSYWATAAGILVALVAGVAAVVKYLVDRRHEDWRRASELYGDFLDCALAHPQFYPDCWDRISKDPELENQYSYFVGKFLWTCEAIVLGRGYDDEWRDCLKVIMREHADYLRSARFAVEKDGYDRQVLSLVEEVIREPSTAGDVLREAAE